MKSFKQLISVAALAAASFAGPVLAQAAAPVVAAAADLSDAEVRKVDTENRKLTLKHGPIKNLDMPAMTMVFQVADPAMLAKLKAGDKIRFKATQDAGKYIVTEIQPAK